MAVPDVLQVKVCRSWSMPTVSRDSRSTKCICGGELPSIAAITCASRPTPRVRGRKAATHRGVCDIKLAACGSEPYLHGLLWARSVRWAATPATVASAA